MIDHIYFIFMCMDCIIFLGEGSEINTLFIQNNYSFIKIYIFMNIKFKRHYVGT